MSDYISKQEAIDSIVKNVIITTEEGLDLRNEIIELIKELPAVDEKEIIRKPFERVVERLESERATENFKALKNANETFIKGCIDNRVFAYGRAIEIIKEECGINE